MSEKVDLNTQRAEPVSDLPGQEVLPDLVAMFGYDTVMLKTEHELFVRELVRPDINATDAYLNVYSTKETPISRAVARRAASRLLTNVDIRRRFDQVKNEIVARADYSAEDAYRDLVNIVKYDRRKLYDEDKKLRHVADLDADGAALIDGIEETRVGGCTTKVKVLLPKRLDALDKVFRYHGAYKDKLEHGGSIQHEHSVGGLLREVMGKSRDLVQEFAGG